ncbi:MAG: hypothetical protein ABR503_09295 [Chitinophagaceae bacterium]
MKTILKPFALLKKPSLFRNILLFVLFMVLNAFLLYILINSPA